MGGREEMADATRIEVPTAINKILFETFLSYLIPVQ